MRNASREGAEKYRIQHAEDHRRDSETKINRMIADLCEKARK